MTLNFTTHTPETAPEAAREILTTAKRAYGFLPNLLGMMAESPALVKAYTTLSGIFDDSTLTPAERQVVLLTVSYHNECEYCMAAHTVIAGMQKVPGDVVAAIRGGAPVADSKLEALRQYTSELVVSKGWPTDQATAAFINAGYGRRQALEVVLGVGLKTLSNYANHIADTPLDAAFSKAAWSKAESQLAVK